MINLPRTAPEEKPKVRAAPRVRASGKYGAKNEKEANRTVKPNFAKRKESMNAIVEQNKQMHLQMQSQLQQAGVNVTSNNIMNQSNIMSKRNAKPPDLN